MSLEYKIIYRIGGDIPINPSWIGDQIQTAVDKQQEKINEKNLHGTHTLELCFPEGWSPVEKKIKKVRAQASKRGRVGPKIFKLDKSSSIG